MLLSQLLCHAGIDHALPDKTITVENIVPDSTRASKNSLFIAIEGRSTDGNAYISEAVSAGACAVIVSKKAIADGRADPRACPVPIIAVDDCREAMARLYAAFYGDPQRKMKFVGVTGTNGKTSVCRILYEILTRSGKKCGFIGTTGCFCHTGEIDIRSSSPLANMTTPDPEELYKILDVMQKQGVEYVVMEVTSHSLALSKVAPIYFDIGIFTNLSEDHLDFHSDMEDYFLEKQKLFASTRQAIINCDDRYGRRLAASLRIRTHTCSCEDGAVDYLATDVKYRDKLGIEYKLISPYVRLRLRSQLLGKFNVMNTLEAAIAAMLLGISPINVKEALAVFRGVEGRLERVKITPKADFSVYIDYAHTPDALENLLRTVRSISSSGQRVVLLFGCGGDRDRGKRAVMGRIASAMADYLIITSDNSRSEPPEKIIKEIISGIDGESQFTVIEDRRSAIEYTIKNARRRDIIILAGKGHEQHEIDREGKKPFSEKELVAEFAEKYYG